MFVTDRKETFETARAPRRGHAAWLCLMAALSVLAAGCTVAEIALPLLPPAPVFSSGTFTVANNFAPCPGGSTPTNPGGQQCAIAGATGTIDVLTDAFLGSSYTSTITTRGGTLPVTSCQIQGTIPAGVTLSASPVGPTCVITGTFPSPLPSLTIPPGGFTAISLTVRATDSANPASVDTQEVVIRIFAGFSFTTTVLENGTQARAYTKIVVSNLGGSIGVPPMTACTATGLPAGLVVATFGNNCRITGTPIVNGTFTVTIIGTDSAANTRSSTAYTLIINAPLVVAAPAFTNGTVGRPYTITVASTAATTGGQRPLTVCSAAGLPPGLTVARNAANTACEISGTPTTAGTFIAVVISATDSATTDPAQGGATVTAAGTSVSVASSITINAPLLVPAFVIGNGTQGRPFTLSVPRTGGNLPLSVCSATGLAAGMTIGVDPGNTANCLLGGTPTANGAFTVVVTVTDTLTANTVAGSASSVGTPLQVNPPLAIPVFTFQPGAETVAYTKSIPTTGGNRPLTVCNAVGLATGLTIALDPANTAVNVNNCIVSGTPAVGSAGPYTVVVTVTDTASLTTAAGNAASANTALTINGPLFIPPFVLGNGTEGRAFQQDVPVTGGIQPLTTCAISAGALPGGLTIAVSPVAGNCRISGSPAAATAGAFAITVQATDTGAPPGTPPATATSASTPLTINPPLLIATLNANVLDAINGRVGYTLAFTNTGGQTTFSWGAVGLGAGACSGMSLSAAGVLTGTPTTPGLCSFTASVTDTATTSTAAGTTPGAFTLTVRPELTFAAVAVADGVEGRNYGLAADTCPGPAPCVQAFPTNALAVAGASDKASAENGNGPLVSCTVLAVTPGAPGPNSLGLGNFAAIPDPGNLNRCRLQSTAPFPALSADVYRITVGATDNPIAAVGVPASIPANVNVTFILTVRTVLTLTEPLGDPLPNAVTGRSYGIGATCGPAGTAACVPVVYTAAGGIPAYTIAVTAGAFPAGFGSVAGANTLTFSSANVTAPAGGPTAVTVTVTDAGNAAVPTAPGAPVAVTRNITVQAALALASNPAVDPPPPGVNGRPYGGPGFTPLTYAATGGIPAYVFGPIASIPAAGLGVPAAVACAPIGTVLTCSSGGGVLTAGAGAYTFNVSVSDTPNVSVPAATVNLATNPQNITVNAALVFTAVNQGDPLNSSVQGRSYGTVLGKLTVFYTVSGGLGSAITGGYNFVTPAFSAVPASAFPTGFACATLPSPNFHSFFCNSPSVAGAPGLYLNIPVTIDDVANATTPGGTASGTTATVTRSLTVNAPLTLTENAGTRVGNAVTLPEAVVGRPVGPHAALPGDLTRVSNVFTAAGGLPGYVVNAVTAPPNPGIPAGYSCILAASTVTCGTAGAPIGAAPVSPFTYNASVTDSQNGSIPTDTVTLNNSLPVNAALAHATTLPVTDGTKTRAFSQAFSSTGGLSNVKTWGVVLPNPNFSGIVGAFTGNAGTPCEGLTLIAATGILAGTPAGATAGLCTFTLRVNDPPPNATTTDASTNGTPVDLAISFTVNPALAITTVALGDTTVLRAFGSGTGISNPPNVDLPILGGEAPYICSSASAVALGLSVAAVNVAGSDFCRITGSASPAGAASITVSVTDSATTTTPTTTTANTASMNFTINTVLTITTPSPLAAGVTGVLYTQPLAVTGGQPGFTWAESGGPSLGLGACGGLSITGAGTITGNPTTTGTCAFTAQVTDTATNTTGSVTATKAFTLDVFAPITIAPWTSVEEDGTVGLAFGTGTGLAVLYPVSGGSGTFTCGSTPALPTGLSVVVNGANCQLVGTPTVTAASTVYQIQATDSNTLQVASTPTASFAIQPALQIHSGVTTLFDAVEARSYTLLIGSTGGTPPRTLSNPTGDGTTLNTGDPDCSGLVFSAGVDTIFGTGGPPSVCTFNLQVAQTATTTTAGNSGPVVFTININQALQIATVQGDVVNGMLGSVHPGMTFAATGGTGTYTWFDPADNPTPCGVLTGSLPTGLTMDAAGVIAAATTTAASTVVTDFEFQVCVEDNAGGTNPAVSAFSAIPPGNPIAGVGNAYRLNVMNRYAYAADTNGDLVHVINSATNAEVDTIAGGGIDAIAMNSVPRKIGVSANGRFAYVTLSGDDVGIIDTITHAKSEFAINGAPHNCNNPDAIAVDRVGLVEKVYVGCDAGRVVILNADPFTGALTASAQINLTNGGTLDSAAFRLDATRSRVYFTDSTNDFLFAINTATEAQVDLDTGNAGETRFDLGAIAAGGTLARGITVVSNGANFYAYIAMDNAEGGTSRVQVHNVTSDVLTNVTNVDVGGAGQDARDVAWDPVNNVVYVTRNGNDDVLQINNALVTPTAVGGDVTGVNGAFGITIPPISGRVYVARNNNDNVDFFAIGAFGADPGAATGIGLIGAARTPTGMGSIRVPR